MKVRRARQTAWRTIAGETVLLDLERKRMYGLNPTGAGIWLALEADADAGELLRVMTDGRPAPFGGDEIESFLAELVTLGLAEAGPLGLAEETRYPVLERRDPPTPPAIEPPELEPPAILWREEVEQIAGTCAMFPSTSPICDQAPFS